ncbi:PREDICTED: LOC110750662 [Prunus dulcis]|uniref:PREDICTED: LOC110750662 n=1 Tax=Prunus dulcis TaxID=3755 RepID=A0A5E4G9C6_PRUDU|nr:PREDICTED: LOC110750662 [Prunus dulcis]
MHCDADVTECQTELDRLRVHLFLAGLDPEFDQCSGNRCDGHSTSTGPLDLYWWLFSYYGHRYSSGA